jgi:hypothetical protein
MPWLNRERTLVSARPSPRAALKSTSACTVKIESQACAIEFAPPDSRLHSATRFLRMPAITKPTFQGQALDIIEVPPGGNIGVPKFQTTEAGRIEDAPTLRPDV